MHTIALFSLLTTATLAASPLPRTFGALTDISLSKRQVYDKSKPRTNRPLVGILGMPVQGESPDPDHRQSNHSAYIAASYVKWVESSGARAVPIVFTWSDEEIIRRFKAVNFLLLPGGGADVCAGRYAEVGRMLLNMSMGENDVGEYMAVWGTCLGYEQMAVAVSGECQILDRFDAEDNASPLVMANAGEDNRLFNQNDKEMRRLRALATGTPPLAMENHVSGISLEAWEKNTKLAQFFDVVTYSLDRNGRKYVSTVEGRKYPFYAVQWHPEKNSFEWTTAEHIPHSAEATLLTQGLSNFVVSEARKSSHQPASKDEEQELLMYNHATTFTGKTWPSFGFDEVYFFD